jgi:hypothetical protein
VASRRRTTVPPAVVSERCRTGGESLAPRCSAGRAALVALLGISLACDGGRPHQPDEVAFVQLTCRPASQGVRCQLLALFRDVRRTPQDVTALASWQLIGDVARARISPRGVIEASQTGDVTIDTHYLSHSAHAVVRLVGDQPGQILATVRGRVYAEAAGVLWPVARARVEILNGPSVGRWTTTDGDGSYELMGVVPGDLVIRVTKVGYCAGDQSAQIEPGDNRRSLLLQLVLPGAAS